MTPERYAYEREKNSAIRQLAAANKELKYLIEGAEDLELVLTIDLVPQTPLAMGNYKMRGDVRITGARRRRLEELEAAAVASEAS